ncbi:hypothetical protein P775_27335 [Puniceibacterium antarcticum]|uniref:Uncharacterized protein n=1 Tax=Puniceibacterium antarcticum TaxID=1206336 RepID=A0A2G8QWM6_9RHOB|nr:hypothetical protein [Puniceibacterium antarcticum]PIL13679.1 hypothetical protein P775_27335 [Puniceibacterium antarcticum]
MNQTLLILPLPSDTFWGLATLLGVTLLMGVVFLALWQMGRTAINPLGPLQERLGLSALNPGLVLMLVTLWGLLFLTLTAGLFGLIFDILIHAVPVQGQTEEVWNWRFKLVQITALTGVLGAVTALPFSLLKLLFSRRQTIAAEEGLITERLSKAIEQLGHEDTAVRMGAIHLLDRIMVDSIVDRVMVLRTLNAYLKYRQPPHDRTGTEDVKDLGVDVQAALDVILKWRAQT